MSLKQFLDQTGLQELITKFTDWCKQSFLGKNDKASNASKLDVADIGNIYKPVFFNNGVPVACEHKLESDVPANAKFTDTVNTYVAGAGISINGNTINNAGVRSIGTGSVNGTISVNSNGTTSNVAVKGLGSAAYTNSNEYATANHNHDTAYAASNHNHDSVYSKLGHNHDSDYATKNHTHSTDYASLNHNHDSVYSKLDHTHDSAYAPINHYHSGYALSSHKHDNLYATKVIPSIEILELTSILLIDTSGATIQTASIESCRLIKMNDYTYLLNIPRTKFDADRNIHRVNIVLPSKIKQLSNQSLTNVIGIQGSSFDHPNTTGYSFINNTETYYSDDEIVFRYRGDTISVLVPETTLMFLKI